MGHNEAMLKISLISVAILQSYDFFPSQAKLGLWVQKEFLSFGTWHMPWFEKNLIFRILKDSAWIKLQNEPFVIKFHVDDTKLGILARNAQ